jgi:hypothetical protein
VPNQIREDASHTIINRGIDHLFAASRGAKKAACSQQTEVMAYETSRRVDARRDFADRGGFSETSEENPQAGRLAEKTQQLGDFRHLGVRERAKVARQGLRNNMRLHVLEPTFGSARTRDEI